MKLPNGYGSVYKLSGKRRKPWVARKTVGWKTDTETMKAQPTYKFIGYYATKTEAMQALAEYNADPKDFESITFSELYEKWSEHTYKRFSYSSQRSYKAAYKICEPIYDMKISEIKLTHLQTLMDRSGKNAPTLSRVKSLIKSMYQYAVAYELSKEAKISMVEQVDLTGATKGDKVFRMPFTDTEIEALRKSTDPFAEIVLILIYTGLRIGELCDLKVEDINLLENYFYVRASKTDAGVRVVPIAKKIHPYITRLAVHSKSGYLIENGRGKKLNYKVMRDNYWDPVMKSIGAEHRPHDTRHTCVSMLTSAGVDDRLIKQIIGHKGNGVTEDVYTHFNLKQKLDAINRI